MNPDIIYLVIALIMLTSAISSGSETAFLSVSKARLHQRLRLGQWRAKMALRLVDRPDHMLTTILLINTLMNIAGSSLITAILVAKFGEVGVLYATVAVSAFILVFAEALPKTIGARFAEPITLALAPTFLKLVWLCTPIIWLVKWLNRCVLRLMGLHNTTNLAFTENDLRGAINLGLQHGTIEKAEQRMLDAVLDLDDLSVADVMIHRSAIAALDVATPPANVPQVLGKLKHSRVPVYEGHRDNIVGVLYVRDYLAALADVTNRREVVLRTLLRQPVYVPETTPVGHQLFAFLQQHQHLALVVDEYGDIQGMISLEDILEEIVGDLPDAHSPNTNIQPAADGSLILPGRLPVRDANRRYGWDLPEDNAVTLAGLLIDTLGHLPAQGESITLGTHTLTVASKRGHRVEKVSVIPTSAPITPPIKKD